MSECEFENAFYKLYQDVHSAVCMENAIAGRASLDTVKPRGRKRKERSASDEPPRARDPVEAARVVLAACHAERERLKRAVVPVDVSDATLSRMAAFTDRFKLRPYQRFLHYVPRLVNCVTLAEAIPVPESGVSLPLDLHHIAARCRNSFYAPKKFSAVQLAYREPRCRVLVFHTGRMVGTGTNGPVAARIALLRAQRQLYTDAGVHIFMQNFSVINTVGAVSLRATLSCDDFASAHTSTAFYDAKSFVGLAWRPAGEPICCEIYSTGRANLPGSVVERQLHESFSRMLPELLRYSSSSRLLEAIPAELQNVHRSDATVARPAGPSVPAPERLWDEWDDRADSANRASVSLVDSDEDVDLSEMGL